MLSKAEVLNIINYALKNNISEKKATKILYNKNITTLYYYKKKYNIKIYSLGMHPNSHINRKKYIVNDVFFSNNTLLSYYYAGFIAADGYIDKKYRYLTIGLSSKDYNWLNIFKLNIEYSGNIYNYKCKHNNKVFPTSYITISSKQLCKDLKNKFNIVNNKSLIYIPPIIKDNTKKDAFIMGLIDGDGGIYEYKIKHGNCQNNIAISLMGTYNTVLFVLNRFSEILNTKLAGNISKSGNQYIYRIATAQARKVFLYFYENYKKVLPLFNRKWSLLIYNKCKKFTKKLHIIRLKGVYIFNLNGELVKYCNTLKEATAFTGVHFSRISSLIKLNDNKHASNGFMFSRNKTISPYEESKFINNKYKTLI